jgi:hypothetical protein
LPLLPITPARFCQSLPALYLLSKHTRFSQSRTLLTCLAFALPNSHALVNHARSLLALPLLPITHSRVPPFLTLPNKNKKTKQKDGD